MVLVLASTVLSITQSEQETEQETERFDFISNKIADLQITVENVDSEKTKLLEQINRPQVRLEFEKIRYDQKTQSLIFPLRNYGKSIATNITMKFDCDQLLNHMEIRQDDLPPDSTLRIFGFSLFLPVPPKPIIGERYRQFADDFISGRKALVFTVSDSYYWNEKRYEIPKREGIWTSDGKIIISLSEPASMSREPMEREGP